MKIGFDVSQTCVERAGCAWFADSLVRALVDLDTDDEFILYHHFGDWINISTEQGTSIDSPRVSSPLRALNHPEALACWAGLHDSGVMPGAPDIVHANNFSAPKVTGAKLVYTVYDVSFWLHPEFATEENRLICQKGVLDAVNRADAFVFISENTRRDFLDMLPLASRIHSLPMAVIPLGSREDQRGNLLEESRSDKPEFWLAVGSLEPRKNYETLLDAHQIYWQTSPSPKPLWIAGGNGWKSDHLRRRIAGLEGSGAVRHLGYVSDAELQRLYRDCYGFLFPSWYEGFGLPVLEAMTAGAPVICSDRASLPEIGGDAVVVVDPADHDQMANVMNKLEADSRFRMSVIEKGLGRAKRYTWTRAANKMMDFYDEVLHDRRTHPG